MNCANANDYGQKAEEIVDLTPEQAERLKNTNLGKLKDLIDNAAVDYLKGLDGMIQPGTKVRKAMLVAKTLTLDIRKEIVSARSKPETE